MDTSLLKSAIPRPVRNKLITGKWFLSRLPYALQYQVSLLQEAPVEIQIELLPAPKQPLIFWTKLENIKLHGSLAYPPHGRLCMGGDWDLTQVYPLPSIFESVPKGTKKWDIHETVRAMFLEGQHYSETPQYELMISAIKQRVSPPPQGCRSIEEVEKYFERLIAAYKSMHRKGYLTQKEQGKSSISEMRLHVTREGKLCLGTGGNHRVRLAELLGVKWVPFLLRGVHPLWVKQLCRTSSLPPHTALSAWLRTEFHSTRP
ncbi:hypothetical protein POKO110462_06290 [Pontibacter korlensis]|uniref:ParB/Sulfiredoxin domain-containing protein n=1 Tax=Pontibacter korlensis TaxID=400092 RepID=A0A0E3UYE4_9BACT|nr:hypothetical protein [Pontibacter korlensis]AKD04401.1 hypothetical protein PKOR_16550 [Pontibacter korlensis]